MLTALSVARDCHMIEPSGKVILVQVTPPTQSQPAQIQWSYAEDMATDVQEVVKGPDCITVEIDDSERYMDYSRSYIYLCQAIKLPTFCHGLAAAM